MLRAMVAALWLLAVSASAAPPLRWDFNAGVDGWTSGHECSLSALDGALHIASTGADPWAYSPAMRVQGPVQVRMRARFATSGQARLYWTVLQPSLVSSAWGEGAVVYFDVAHDNAWREITVPVDVDGVITQLRLDPGKSAGVAEIDWVVVEPLRVAEPTGPTGGAAKAVTVAAGPITVTLDPRGRTLSVRDARTRRLWRSDRFRGLAVTSARKAGASDMDVGLRELSSGLAATCRIQAGSDGSVRFALKAADPRAAFSRFSFPPALRADLADGALVFTNRSCGQLIGQGVTDYPAAALGSYSNLGLDMPWVGVVDRKRGDGAMLLLETPCDAFVSFERDPRGRMWPQAQWTPAKGAFAYARAASYRFTPSGGYAAQAQLYRRYADATGLTRTLAQKAAARPRVRELLGSASVWGLPGGKGEPIPAVRMAAQMKAHGLFPALLNLAMDVPDEAVPALNSMGFLTGEYDNYDDVREGPIGITSGPVEKHALRLQGGAKATGWVNEDGSQMYRRSTSVVTGVAREVVPAMLKRRPFSARFLDVTSSVDLMEDYGPTQGYDRRGDLRNRLQLYGYVNSLGLVVGGEHGKAWSLPVVDYAEGKLSGPFWWEMPAGYLKVPKTRDDIKANYRRWGVNPAARIPLWDLAFHDCMVDTWYWGDCSGYYTDVAPEVDEFQDLSTMLYGGVPLYWMNHLGYGWDRHRARLLESYWLTSSLHKQIGFAKMISHRFLTPDGMVQETRYAGGGRVTVNYGKAPYRMPGSGALLAPYGFVAAAPGVTQSRTMVEGSPLTVVRATDRLFVRTTRLQTVGGVTVNGRAFIYPGGNGRTHLLVGSTDTSRIDLGPGAHRIARLDDEGKPTEAFREVAGTLELPGGEGLRLYGVEGTVAVR